MSKTPSATFLQDYVVRSTDAITGEDSATGPGNPVIIRGGSSTFAAATGGGALFSGGEAGVGGLPGSAAVTTGGTLPRIPGRGITSNVALFSGNDPGGLSEGAIIAAFGGTSSSGGDIQMWAGDASSGSVSGGAYAVNAGLGLGASDGGEVRMVAGAGGTGGGTGGGVIIAAGGASFSTFPGAVQLVSSSMPSVLGAGLELTPATATTGGMAQLSGGQATLTGGLAGGSAVVTGGSGDGSGAGGSITIAGGLSPTGIGGSVSVSAGGGGGAPGVVNLDGPLGRDAGGYKYGFLAVTGTASTTGALTYGVGPLAGYTSFGSGPGPVVITATWAFPGGVPTGIPTTLIVHSITPTGFTIDWASFGSTSGGFEIHWAARL